MKMAMKNGMILMVAVDDVQKAIIKSWGTVRWNKQAKWWEAPICAELLNKLATLVLLPDNIEAERLRLNAIQEAVDRERVKPAEQLSPFVKYPVTKSLYAHQMRAANMALLTFGIIKPEEVSSSE